jgi:hypothetical protein
VLKSTFVPGTLNSGVVFDGNIPAVAQVPVGPTVDDDEGGNRAVYTFAGYWDTPVGGPTEGKQWYTNTGALAAGINTYTLNSDVTLYARYTTNVRLLSYAGGAATWNTSGGSVCPLGGSNTYCTLQNIMIGQLMPNVSAIMPPTYSGEGRTFVGIYTSADAILDGTDTERWYSELGAPVSGRRWDARDAAFSRVDGRWVLYGNWPIAVTFNKMGGTGGTDATSKPGGLPFPTIIPPTMAGGTFEGYYWSPDAGSTLQYKWYNANGTCASTNIGGGETCDRVIDLPVTLYAKWTTTMRTVTLNVNTANVGSLGNPTAGTASITQQPQGGNMAVSGLTMPTPASGANYEFLGYFNAASGGIKYINKDGTSAHVWDVNNNGRLWAQYGDTISLNSNGGLGVAPTSIAQRFATPMETLTTLPTRDGYVFQGFYSNNACSGTRYYKEDGSSAQNYITGARATGKAVYACWYVAMSFNPNHDSVPATTLEHVVNGVSWPSPIDVPFRLGYNFTGYWSTQAGNGTQYYLANGALNGSRTWVSGDAGRILYAGWQETSNVTVTLNSDNQFASYSTTVSVKGGQSMPAIVDQTYCGKLSSPDVEKTLAGFFAEKNGVGTMYYDALCAPVGVYDRNDATTIYAFWDYPKTTITLNANGNSYGTANETDAGSVATVSVSKDSNPPAITGEGALPSRIGYAFAGYWNTSASSDGTQYYNASGVATHVWDSDSPTATLYARWTAKQYTVYIYMQDKCLGADNCGDQTEGTASYVLTYDTASVLPVPASEYTPRASFEYYSDRRGGVDDGGEYILAGVSKAQNLIKDKTSTSVIIYAIWGV